jgi:hypothetical protein
MSPDQENLPPTFSSFSDSRLRMQEAHTSGAPRASSSAGLTSHRSRCCKAPGEDHLATGPATQSPNCVAGENVASTPATHPSSQSPSCCVACSPSPTACAASRRMPAHSCSTHAPEEGSRRDHAAMIAATVLMAAGAWCSSVQALVEDFEAFPGTLIAAVCTGFGVWGGGIVVSCCCTASAKVGRTDGRRQSRRNPGAHPAKSEEVNRGNQALQRVLDELKKANKRGVQAIKKYDYSLLHRGYTETRRSPRPVILAVSPGNPPPEMPGAG